METQLVGGNRHYYDPSERDFGLSGSSKKSLDWDLNDWKWDGDLFVATPMDRASLSLRGEKGKLVSEKRGRDVVIGNDDNLGDLSLNLGVQGYGVVDLDGKNGKKTKLSGPGVCQVDRCAADLTNAKDYHRRHKVCEEHSKASTAVVGNAIQRFCQQCSRFHDLQEFDEEKRSCRRRLAGHNRRRRKTLSDAVVDGSPLNNDRSSTYLLISLLRILSNINASNSDQPKEQDLLSHLVTNLSSFASTSDGGNLSRFLLESQNLLSFGAAAGTPSAIIPSVVSNCPESSRLLNSTVKTNGSTDAPCPQMRTVGQNMNCVASEVPQKEIGLGNTSYNALYFPKQTITSSSVKDHMAVNPKLTNIDLNSLCDDAQDCVEDMDMSQPPFNNETGSLVDCPSRMQKDSHQSSPPQTSGNSDSASAPSPSSSSGDQSRTDRIVFKLFDKNPNHFPLALRSQILDWLSHSPTEIESYIRPGCIILTIYLRLTESKWEELSNDLGSSLSRLLDVSDNNFWKTGWIYSRVQHRVAFIYNGQIVLDTSLTLEGHNRCRISSVTPIAVSVSDATQFVVKGFNLFQNTTRLLCALEGSYLLQKDTNELVDSDDMKEHVEFESLRFDCPVPELTGRGFVEVEDDGLSNGFFPFVVANQEMCSEIRMLESVIEVVDSIDDVHLTSAKVKARSQALDFIHEIGWLLHRSHLRFGLGEAGSNSDVFSFSRFRWIIEFSVDHDWCAVVKNLLDILFDGTVGLGEHTSVELALSDLGLLHRAVRRNCRKMVDLLLHYVPDENLDISGSKSRHLVNRSSGTFLFRPDVDGPAGLTPLHVAASRDCSENVLDALTDDPGLVGILGWKNACDSTGSTPEDYARQRGNYSYIHLVHRKISKKSNTSHIILDIPSAFQIEKCESRPVLIQRSCKLCNHQLASGSLRRAPAFYRPAMLSMLAIAAVCVCVGLLFKSTFRWELLNYGYY